MDYKNAKIYKIVSYQTDDIYIGSTCQPLYKRFGEHKKDYKNWLNTGKKYVSSYEILKYDDAHILLIEEFPCENKEQLRKKEGEYIRELKCVNKLIAGRTNREWFMDNKEHITEYQKEYKEINKEKIQEYNKQYLEMNKEKLKEDNKQYYQMNKDALSQYKKNYYQSNKYEILERIRKTVQCECGSVHAYGERSRHNKSKKHQKYLASQFENEQQ